MRHPLVTVTLRATKDPLEHPSYHYCIKSAMLITR
jgi:hypothetical protein